MADIFGREAYQYTYLRALEEAGFSVQDHLTQRAAKVGAPVHDFNALGAFQGRRVTDIESNTQALGFLENNLEALNTRVTEIYYGDNRLTKMVPIETNVPPGVETFAYVVVDKAGEGEYITNDGTDAPSATVSTRKVPFPIDYGGIVAMWTKRDLRGAMFANIPLDDMTLVAAVRGAMNHMQRIAFQGDVRYGYKGLINQLSTVVTQVDASSPIESMNAEDVVNFLNEAVTERITDTAEVFGTTLQPQLCIYLPHKQAARITTARMASVSDKSIWQYFQMNNYWKYITGKDIMLKPLAELSGAAGTNQDRMIVGFMDPVVMSMTVALAPRVILMQDRGYQVCAPLEYETSPLNIKRPDGLKYYDIV